MNQQEDFHFTIHEGDDQLEIKAWHYSQLTAEEVADLKITENTFYVQTLTGDTFEAFELFQDEHEQWRSQPDVLKDHIISAIGDRIERLSL